MDDLEGWNRQLSEENRWLKDRLGIALNSLDEALNTIGLQKEQIQSLKDEIATLKGQKRRPLCKAMKY